MGKLIYILFFCNVFFTVIQSQNLPKGYDPKLDSILKSKSYEYLQDHKRPMPSKEMDKIVQRYRGQKDSTFLSNLQFKISDAPKEEALQSIYDWLEVYITTNRRIDTAWHATMQYFYSLDRYLTYQYCSENLMIRKDIEGERYSTSIQDTFKMTNFPHAKFIYDHYALTEFLPAITKYREVPEDANYYFVYRFFYYLKEKTCRRDPVCLEEIHRFVKSYYEVEKDEKANSVFMEALESDQAFRTKSTWLKFGNQGKKE